MTGCRALKSLQVQQVPTECIFCDPALSTTRQRTTPNIESCFHRLEKEIQEEFVPALLGKVIDDGDYRLELARLPVK